MKIALLSLFAVLFMIPAGLAVSQNYYWSGIAPDTECNGGQYGPDDWFDKLGDIGQVRCAQSGSAVSLVQCKYEAADTYQWRTIASSFTSQQTCANACASHATCTEPKLSVWAETCNNGKCTAVGDGATFIDASGVLSVKIISKDENNNHAVLVDDGRNMQHVIKYKIIHNGVHGDIEEYSCGESQLCEMQLSIQTNLWYGDLVQYWSEMGFGESNGKTTYIPVSLDYTNAGYKSFKVPSSTATTATTTPPEATQELSATKNGITCPGTGNVNVGRATCEKHPNTEFGYRLLECTGTGWLETGNAVDDVDACNQMCYHQYEGKCKLLVSTAGTTSSSGTTATPSSTTTAPTSSSSDVASTVSAVIEAVRGSCLQCTTAGKVWCEDKADPRLGACIDASECRAGFRRSAGQCDFACTRSRSAKEIAGECVDIDGSSGTTSGYFVRGYCQSNPKSSFLCRIPEIGFDSCELCLQKSTTEMPTKWCVYNNVQYCMRGGNCVGNEVTTAAGCSNPLEAASSKLTCASCNSRVEQCKNDCPPNTEQVSQETDPYLQCLLGCDQDPCKSDCTADQIASSSDSCVSICTDRCTYSTDPYCYEGCAAECSINIATQTAATGTCANCQTNDLTRGECYLWCTNTYSYDTANENGCYSGCDTDPCGKMCSGACVKDESSISECRQWCTASYNGEDTGIRNTCSKSCEYDPCATKNYKFYEERCTNHFLFICTSHEWSLIEG